MPNRRNVLIGLGGLVAGGGALIGTGAFDTVEAERTVSVETEGDADAFLGLTAAGDPAENDFVEEEAEGTISINIDATADAEGGGEGLNQNARTRFNNLVTITNQGTQDVDSITLGFTSDDQAADQQNLNYEDTFTFPVSANADESDFQGNGDLVSPGESGEPGEILTGNNTPSDLTPGDEVTFGLEIDLIEGGDENDDLPNGDYTLTIEANAA